MADKKIFSYVNTLANLVVLLVNKQRGILSDLGKNWVFKDNSGNTHIVADQRVFNSVSEEWEYAENDLGSTVFHGTPELSTASVVAVLDSGELKYCDKSDLLADVASAAHTHSSLVNGSRSASVTSEGLLILPGDGTTAIKSNNGATEFYKLEESSWVLTTSIE